MEIKEAYEMFSSIWRLYRKYSEKPITERYWDVVIGEVDVIQSEYPTDLCKNLLVAVLGELERKEKALVR